MKTLVELEGFGYAYPDAAEQTLQGIDLHIGAGEVHCLTGATGSGKTTLALALKGMLPAGRRQGSIRFTAAVAPNVGLVLQNPETQLFASLLGEEVAFALENRGVSPSLMPAKVAAALRAVGLDRSFQTEISTLSMGEKYRALLAAVLIMEPELLILDEPAAQLDQAGLNELRKVLEKIVRQGTAVLLCEHRPQVFDGLVDHCWRLDNSGRLSSGRISEVLSSPAAAPVDAWRRPVLDRGDLVVRGEHLATGSVHGAPLWAGASFSFKAGQRILVQGSNGAGKSTLLRLLAGLTAPLNGDLKVFGRKPSVSNLRGRLGVLFQNPQRQLFEDRVIDEVAFSLKRRGLSVEECRTRSLRVLDQCGIADLADRSPHKLSFGQKHLVALASVLVGDPELLLLDDPFAGLDERCRRAVRAMLMNWNERAATTIVWTSHHEHEEPAQADVLLRIAGGKIACRTVRG